MQGVDMTNGKNGNGHRWVVDELTRLANTSDDSETWRELVDALKGNEDKPILEREEDNLRAASAMRAAGVVDGALAFYMVAHPLICIAQMRMIYPNRPDLNRISKAMREIEKSHGLAVHECWPKGNGPDDWNELADEYDRVQDEIIAATFDGYGERVLGEMYRHDRNKFDAFLEQGERLFSQPKFETH